MALAQPGEVIENENGAARVKSSTARRTSERAAKSIDTLVMQ